MEICQANADIFGVYKGFTPLQERSSMRKEETAQGDNKSQAPLKFHVVNVKSRYRSVGVAARFLAKVRRV